MSVTISSDVPAILVLTLHPVFRSNGVTQLTLGSLEPFSAYPAQATRLTWPSPWPSEASLSIFGGLMPPGPLPVLVSPPPEPQAARARTPAAATARNLRRMVAPIQCGEC